MLRENSSVNNWYVRNLLVILLVTSNKAVYKSFIIKLVDYLFVIVNEHVTFLQISKDLN